MKHFLVVQHTYSEFLGLIERQLENRDIGFTYCRPFTGQDVPGNALQHDALWLLGGAHPVTDAEHCPWVADEVRLVGLFRKAKRPVVGIGFGGLVVALAAGGRPHAEPAHSAYWTVARATEAGRDDPLAQAVDGRTVLVMYDGRVDLPAAVPVVATDAEGRWIAARPDAETYALLFRPELKPGMLEDMIMEEARPTPDHIGELLGEARERWNEMQATTDRVLVALVSALDLMQERRKAPVFKINVAPS
ncbi:MAG: type 1 glutamine amidotransferase [Pseudomonadota bacterium]